MSAIVPPTSRSEAANPRPGSDPHLHHATSNTTRDHAAFRAVSAVGTTSRAPDRARSSVCTSLSLLRPPRNCGSSVYWQDVSHLIHLWHGSGTVRAGIDRVGPAVSTQRCRNDARRIRATSGHLQDTALGVPERQDDAGGCVSPARPQDRRRTKQCPRAWVDDTESNR